MRRFVLLALGAAAAACFPALQFAAGDPAPDAAASEDGRAPDGGADAPTDAATAADVTPADADRDGSPDDARSAAGFPSTAVLDDFNRADGGLGTRWGVVEAFAIESNELVARPQSGTSYAFYTQEAFDVAQEAFVTLRSPAGAQHTELLLHSSGSNVYSCLNYDTVVAIVWNGGSSELSIETCVPNPGRDAGQPLFLMTTLARATATFATGQRLGARIEASGLVTVFRDAAPLLTATLPAELRGLGGDLGIISRTQGARYDGFGGGTLR